MFSALHDQQGLKENASIVGCSGSGIACSLCLVSVRIVACLSCCMLEIINISQDVSILRGIDLQYVFRYWLVIQIKALMYFLQ